MKKETVITNNWIAKKSDSCDLPVRNACMGKIALIDFETKTVFVNFEGNPLAKPLLAKLGRPFHLSDLKKGLEKGLEAKIGFEDGDPTKPIIYDVFYSVLDEDQPAEDSKEKNIHIKAKRIILEADQEIVIKSGEARAVYMHNGRISSKGKMISSQAAITNKIQGGSVTIN